MRSFCIFAGIGMLNKIRFSTSWILSSSLNHLYCITVIYFLTLLPGILADFAIQATLFTAFLALDTRRYNLESVTVTLYFAFIRCRFMRLIEQWQIFEKTRYFMYKLTSVELTCESIRFSSLFAAGEVSLGGTSATQQQKFHTDDVKSVQNPVRSADWSTEQLHCLSYCLQMTDKRPKAIKVKCKHEESLTKQSIFVQYSLL